MPTVSAVICSSLRASIGTTSSKYSIVTRTMSTVCRSAMRRVSSCGTSVERLGGVADVAVGIAHPLGEVDHRGLHDELHAGPLRRLELGEERQPVAP